MISPKLQWLVVGEVISLSMNKVQLMTGYMGHAYLALAKDDISYCQNMNCSSYLFAFKPLHSCHYIEIVVACFLHKFIQLVLKPLQIPY